jgi:hypothetical protein
MINKSLIERKFKSPLVNLGYTYLKDNTTVADGLFYKLMDDNLIIEIGFTISKNKDEFTFSFYLSPTFQFALSFNDMPRNNYKRGAELLTSSERAILLPGDYIGVNIVDGWWRDLSDETISKIVDVIKITEPRFLQQENLISGVKNSVNAKKRITEYYSIMNCYKSLHININGLESSDFTISNNLPEGWLKCTQKHFIENRDYIKESAIKSFAIESWRYFSIIPNVKSNIW